MNKNIVITAIILIAVLVVGLVYYANYANIKSTSDILNSYDNRTPGTDAGKQAGTVLPGTYAISYGTNGFSPNTVTIKKGDTVTWTNQSGNRMWVASAMHPSHEVYAGTALAEHCPDVNRDSFDQCVAGDSYSFSFQKTGTWKYHNHAKATDFGTVVVEQ